MKKTEQFPMQRLLAFCCVIALFVVSCTSSTKHLNRGEYDMAVQKAVAKIQKDPQNEKEILVLEKAYPLANQKNEEEVRRLKMGGRPENWEQILENYRILDQRQTLVKTVLPKHVGHTIDFPYVDYAKLIIEAKNNAAAFWYANAQQLLKENTREKSREAYYELDKIKSVFQSYLKTDSLMQVAREKGTSHVLIKVLNNSNIQMDDRYYADLINVVTNDLNKDWVRYYNNPFARTKYDYNINVNLRLMDVSPERMSKSETEETKTIQDGWEYVLDGKGNVVKDSLGNDLKKPKYKNISCRLITNRQEKAAHIEGSIDYIDNTTKQNLHTEPIAADHFFSHEYCTALGDLNALSRASRDKIGNDPVAFPNNLDMIMAASQTLKQVINDVLFMNKNIIR